MLIFPQLSTLASAQYPIAKRTSRRSVQSVMEDGTIISLADVSGACTRWKLTLRDLSDQEASSLQTFFSSTRSGLLPFLFADPAMNLLSWSSDLSRVPWQIHSLTLESGFADPLGGSMAFRLTNTASVAATISQSSQIPGSLQTCFSIYLRSDSQVGVTLARSAGTVSSSLPIALAVTWNRYSLSTVFAGVADASTYAITIPSLGSVSLFGPQVDAQLVPSAYIATSGAGGVYPNARFDMESLTINTTGPNRNSCELLIRNNGV